MCSRLSIQFISLKDAKGEEISNVLIYLKKLKEKPTFSGTSIQLKEKDSELSLVFNFNHEYALSSADEYLQVMFLEAEGMSEYLVNEVFWLYGLYDILSQTKATKKNNPEIIHSNKLTGDYTLTFRLRMIEDACADRHFKSPYEIRGHVLSLKTFSQFVYCVICRGFIWGASKQGYQCDKCKMVLHIKCRERVPFWCPLSFIAHPCLMTGNHSAQIEIPHVFIPIRRSFADNISVFSEHCHHCGSSPSKDARKCRSCNIVIHEKCRGFLPPLCGTSYHILQNQLDSGIVRETFNTSDSTDSDSRHSLSEKSSLDVKLSFPTSSLLPKWSDFKCIGRLGEGAFSKVYAAQHMPTREYMVLKVVDRTDAEARRQVESEKTLLFQISHLNPYIIKAYCAFHHGSYLFLVTEFVGGDTLYQKMSKKPLNEDEVRYYLVEIISVLQYLHSRQIVYRDLKLEHIVVCTEGHIRLIDYGLIKILEDDNELCNTICGTPLYLAPEITHLETGMIEKDYSYSVDYWALGIVFAQLLYGEPFSGMNDLTAESIDELLGSKNMTEAARALLYGLLEKDPDKRLGSVTSPYGNIREHAFFTCSKALDWTLIDKGNYKSINAQSTFQYYESETFDGLPFTRSSLNRDCQQEWQKIGDSAFSYNIDNELQLFDSINENIKSVFTRKK